VFFSGSPIAHAALDPDTLLPTGTYKPIQLFAAAIALSTHVPSLPIITFNMAETSEANMIVVRSLPTLLNYEIASLSE